MVAFFFTVDKLLGLVRDAAIGHVFGASAALELTDALSNSLGASLQVVLLLVAQRRLGGVEVRASGASFARTGLASALMGAAVAGIRALVPGVGLLVTGAGGLAMGATT